MTLVDRALAVAEERFGVTVLPAEEVTGLREAFAQFREFREEASDLAYHSLDYFSGRPQEWRPERRKRLAQRARIALQGDPLAGAEAEHYANFALGKGIGVPVAEDPKVQDVITRGWTDHNNAEVFTGYDAQRAVSNELKAGANVYPLAFVRGGRVRVSWLDADTIEEVITDPDARHRVLWYKGYKAPTRKWNWEQDRFELDEHLGEGGVPKVTYYQHWRNLEDARRERTEAGVPEAAWPPELRDPPADKKGEGLVYHVRVNRLLEQVFGVPPWARTLRFYTAMNRFLESRVAMAQASASFIAKRILHGGPKSIMDAAHQVLRQTGEIGSRHKTEEPEPQQRVRPGSFFVENEQHKLEALSLNSGAANAVQDGQIIRGAAVAASAFGQHMFGAAESTDLSTASALELPATMAIGAWQETLEQMYRWFTNLLIEAAVRAGELGGAFSPTPDEPTRLTEMDISELSLFEADGRAEAERRTGLRLLYTFQMPFPGRRALPDVHNTLQVVLNQIDPEARNEPLVKTMLVFLFTHGLELEDPAGTADRIWEAQAKVLEEKQKREDEAAKRESDLAQKALTVRAASGARPSTAAPKSRDPGAVGGNARNGVAKGAKTRGAAADPKRTKALSAEEVAELTPEEFEEWMGEQLWLPEDLRDRVDELAWSQSSLFREAIVDPAVLAVAAMNGHRAPSTDPESDPNSGA